MTGNLSRFLSAVETLRGLAAVSAEWQSMLGDEWTLARPYLRARPELAASFPAADGGPPYEVVDHGSGEFVGVCREAGRVIRLTADQLVVYELDRRRFAATLARALNISTGGELEDWSGTTVRLGLFKAAAGSDFACFLAFPHASADVHAIAAQLAAQKQAPFVLLAPTRRWVRREAETVLKFHGCAFAPLDESIAASGPGALCGLASLDEVIPRATGVVSVSREADGANAARNTFRRDGDIWTLTFADTTVRLKDLLGLRCLYRLIEAKGRSVEALELKSVATGRQLAVPAAGLETIDPQAFQRYKADYDDLVERLAEAKENNDLGVQERLQEKIDALAHQLASAKGLGGRTRRVKDGSARLRTSVTNAVVRAIRLLDTEHAELGRHFAKSVSTGTTLCYSPDPDVDWDL